MILLLTAVNSWGAMELIDWLGSDNGNSSDGSDDEAPDEITLNDGVLAGSSGDDYLTPGNDAFEGQTIISVNGGAGDDFISGTLGAETMDGGEGDDEMHVIASGTYTGGPGNDVFDIESNINHWWLEDTSTLSEGVITDYTKGEDQLVMSLRSVGDELTLSSLNVADDGEDSLITYSYAPTTDATGIETATIRVTGAAGLTLDDITVELDEHETADGETVYATDFVDGSSGDDDLSPIFGNDEAIIRAGDGDDVVAGAALGTNALLGEGNDSYSSDGEGNVVHGESGDDEIISTATTQSDDAIERLYGGNGDDTITSAMEEARLYGGFGDDEISGAASSSISGGEGDDVLTVTTEGTGTDIGVTQIRGDQGNDTITGSATDDEILDHQAGTVAVGAFDDDIVMAEAGADILVHQFGDDSYSGGAGDDLLYSIQDEDDPAPDAVTFDGGDGDDTLVGSMFGAGDSLTGDAGDDLLVSGMVRGDVSSETVGETTTLTIERTIGDAGSDTLDGGEGDDTLLFDRADSVTGGDGEDDFRLDLTDDATADGDFAIITDYDRAEDVIALHVEDAGTAAVTVANGASASTVSVDGFVVLQLDGVLDLSADDIVVTDTVSYDNGIYIVAHNTGSAVSAT
ncbi:calcium-binding protein [Thalassovita gelatinovora]|nr:calcium-binding protein [Thalassovita gelatinovora]QIZ79701.1 calcium-binding protein [Thalassovita gelatinovora]